MDIKVTSLDGADAGTLTLKDDIFGLEPRVDILQRMVRYQGLKAMAGTHKSKGRAEIAYTGHKVGKQKGGGVARHGSRRAPQFRGGGKAFGPVVRSHEIDLPKKVRALALKHALSSKAQAGELSIVDTLSTKEAKTSALQAQFGKLAWSNALIIDGAELDANFALAARNIPQIDVLPIQGINVADILRRNRLVLTKAAVEALEARFA